MHGGPKCGNTGESWNTRVSVRPRLTLDTSRHCRAVAPVPLGFPLRSLCFLLAFSEPEYAFQNQMQAQFPETEMSRLRLARKNAGWTLQELANKTGYSVSTISTLEKRGLGSTRLLLRIVEVLLINTKWLKQGEEPMFLRGDPPPRPSLPQKEEAPQNVLRDGPSAEKLKSLASEILAVLQESDPTLRWTKIHGEWMIEGMQKYLPMLMKRVQRAIQSHGTQGDFARSFGVSEQTVSAWLSSEREPGGETTLRLLQWVEQQEAQQQKSPDSALTPPGPKAQVRKSNHEKPNSGPG
jgi:transcriptional regulator with XRE-family HTH domain